MKRDERCAQLRKIMYEHHESALSQADFSAGAIAADAGISQVRFYALVGEDYKELRAKLKGPMRSGKSIVSRLRQEIKELRTQLKEQEITYQQIIQDSIAGAIRHIELLDGENRMLRVTVAKREQQLKEYGIIITVGEVAPGAGQEVSLVAL